MSDNASAHRAADYDVQIRKTIPYYDQFHEEVIDLVRALGVTPARWLDTGCGTGTLVERAHAEFPSTHFVLADPAPAMLDRARERLAKLPRVTMLAPCTSQALALDEPADVVTAIQCHHYLSRGERERAVRSCHRALRPGGLFVTFENIRPLSARGTQVGQERWRRFEVRQGKSEQEARAHVGRFGTEYFPITIEEHLELLRSVGFQVVEVLWYSYLQAGFYAIR